MSRKARVLIAALGLVCSSACAQKRIVAPPPTAPGALHPDEAVRVTAAELEAQPREYKGSCPAIITFRGVITVEGGPGTVTYTFARSDRATAPVQTLNFALAGPKIVQTTWTLGQQPERPFEGWQRLIVLTPVHLESKAAGFSMMCR